MVARVSAGAVDMRKQAEGYRAFLRVDGSIAMGGSDDFGQILDPEFSFGKTKLLNR